MPNISLNLGLKHRKDNNMRYIDAEKLKELIYEKIKILFDKNVKVGGGKWDAEIFTYLSVLRLIDSLQQERPDDVVVVAKAFLDALSKTPYNNKPITDTQIIVKQLLLFFENPKEYNPDAILEQPEVDLEKEIKDYIDQQPLVAAYGGVKYQLIPPAEEIARHFYKLGLNARKEE